MEYKFPKSNIKKGLKNKTTVIVVTSPIPTHPNTDIVDEAIQSALDLDYKFHDGVAYSILNGLRMYIIYLDNKATWSKDVEVIKKIFLTILPELIKIVRNHNKQIGYNTHLLGKSKLLYSIMYKELLMGDMLNQFQ